MKRKGSNSTDGGPGLGGGGFRVWWVPAATVAVALLVLVILAVLPSLSSNSVPGIWTDSLGSVGSGSAELWGRLLNQDVSSGEEEGVAYAASKVASEGSGSSRGIGIAGVAVLVLLLLGCVVVAERVFPLPRVSVGKAILCFVMLIFYMVSLLVISLIAPPISPLSIYLPGAMASIVVALVVSPGVGVLMAGITSLIYLIATGGDYPGFLYSLSAGVVASLMVTRLRRRSSVVLGTLILATTGGMVLFAIGMTQGSVQPILFGLGVAGSLGNGILAFAILPLLEWLLRCATPFKLLELLDLGTPMMQKMMHRAPGTYNHSLAVANLAEAAAKAIGANHLLARVGGYYHDIGKVEQANYFTENQAGDGENKHSELKTSLSTAVIRSHVKIGVEKALELRLPQEVVDIISQHHGSGVIDYFYAQALKRGGTRDSIVRKDYSYAGSPPLSKEAAIVMLADGAEAISRTIEKPTITKLDRMVWEIILKRIDESQMARSYLTFNDMETIKNAFVKVLSGVFHSRIEYPSYGDVSSRPTGTKRVGHE